MACLLKLLQLTGKVDDDGQNFSSRSLRNCLEADGKWQDVREIIQVMLNESYVINQDYWSDVTASLSAIFGIEDMPEASRAYLSFSEDDVGIDIVDVVDDDPPVLTSMPGNSIRHADGFVIELSTIHGVKGETHDATLVMETKNYCFDLGVMVPYLTGEFPDDAKPNVQMANSARNRRANKQFMRQFYVAMSRPRHLLCLALHSDRLLDHHERLLLDRGWTVLRLSLDSKEDDTLR